MLHKPFMLLAALCLTLGGCLGTNSAPPAGSAPLAATAIDDQAVNVALETFDTVLTLVDSAITAKLIIPQSPRALKIADQLRTTQHWLNAAVAAQAAGSTTDYGLALLHARSAMSEARRAIKGESQ